MGAVLQKLGFGGDEGGGDAAVKRQAEGLSNPMYQLANLMGQVTISQISNISKSSALKKSDPLTRKLGVYCS